MITSFSKIVFIKHAELDRLQQRQLREHLFQLQAMVHFLNNMRDITANMKHWRGAIKLDLRLANLIR